MHPVAALLLTFAAGVGAGFVLGLGASANQLRATNHAADREKEIAQEVQRRLREQAWNRVRKVRRN